MPDVEITYNNSTIASLSDSGTEVLETSGTYLTDDITVQYTKSGGSSATTVSFGDDALFAADKIVYVDSSGSVQVVSTMAQFSACSYQLLSKSTIVAFGDMASGGVQLIGTFSGFTSVSNGQLTILASRGSGTLAYAIYQVD